MNKQKYLQGLNVFHKQNLLQSWTKIAIRINHLIFNILYQRMCLALFTEGIELVHMILMWMFSLVLQWLQSLMVRLMVWYGLVWYGLVWVGMGGYGLVWAGTGTSSLPSPSFSPQSSLTTILTINLTINLTTWVYIFLKNPYLSKARFMRCFWNSKTSSKF